MFRVSLGPDASMALLEPRHAQALFEAIDDNRDHLAAWFPWVEDHDDASEAGRFITTQLQAFAARTGLCCGIWKGERLVGTVGCHAVSERFKSAEIGYWLTADATGRGLVTRACRALLGYLFDERGLNRIALLARVDNRKSCAVAERLGFTREGVRREGDLLDGVFRDVAVYSLLAREWPASKAR